MENKIIDYIQCETTSDTLEIHRGRGGYNWKGQKGKNLLWTIPVKVEKSADELLEKIYNCEYWQTIGQGRETSKLSPVLVEFIWWTIMPHIDMKSMRQTPKMGTGREAMKNAQSKGTYVISNKKEDIVIGSNECYTFYQSVEFVANYFCSLNKDYFKDKVVYCNCDDTKSAFWIYFYNNFHKLGLKELIATHYDGTGLSYGNDANANYYQKTLWEKFNGYIMRYDGTKIRREPPVGMSSTFHGDFREKVCLDIARNEADIIMTNPPFGELWRPFVECMLSTKKKLIFWGNNGAMLYNWMMPYLNEKKLHVIDACSDKAETSYFMTPNYYRKRAGAYIYTTEDMSFQKLEDKYYSTKQWMLDNGFAYYDDNGILICDRYVPKDYNETIGISIYPIKKGILNSGYEIVDYHRYAPKFNGKEKFARILVKKI